MSQGNEQAVSRYQEAGLLAGTAADGMLATQQSREVAQALGMMQIARQFPRRIEKATQAISLACERPSLAMAATYLYKRAGQDITGPSIRLMEEIAREWGNIDFGYVIISETRTSANVIAYATDLETNFRASRSFIVRYERKARETVVPLTDPRDIYEHTAAFAMRRVRSCLEEVIPSYVVEEALQRCEQTLGTQAKTTPIEDVKRKMVAAFAKFSVTQEMLERKVGHPLAEMTQTEIGTLTAIFNALKDGGENVDDHFERTPVEPEIVDEAPKDATQAERVQGAAKNRRKKATQKKKTEPKSEPAPAAETSDTESEIPFAKDGTFGENPAYVKALDKIKNASNQNTLAAAAQTVEELGEIGQIDAEEAAALFAEVDARRV